MLVCCCVVHCGKRDEYQRMAQTAEYPFYELTRYLTSERRRALHCNRLISARWKSYARIESKIRSFLWNLLREKTIVWRAEWHTLVQHAVAGEPMSNMFWTCRKTIASLDCRHNILQKTVLRSWMISYIRSTWNIFKLYKSHCIVSVE
jgi:hypothetical protein